MANKPILALAGWLLVATPALAQPVDGGALFRQRCQSCHAVALDRPAGIGPNLAGVVGRKAASTSYAYSSALKASRLTWTDATLDRFLAGPGKLVPGTRMPVAIADPAQRAAIIAWLARQR